MRPLVLPLALFLVAAAPPTELQSWKSRAANITIVRDDFGIAHISGVTDADQIITGPFNSVRGLADGAEVRLQEAPAGQ